MLVGADQGEAGFVAAAQSRIGQREHLQREVPFGGDSNETVCIARVAVRHQQRVALAEMIVQRRAIREPQMRREAAGVGGRHVQHEMLRWRRAAVVDHDGRIVIAHTEHDSERAELALLRRQDDFTNLAARRLSDQPVGFQRRAHQLVRRRAEIDDGFGDGTLVDLPPLELVGGEQIATAPALQPRRQLPTEIDGVADAHVHAEAAEWGMQMARIARQKYPALGVGVGHEPVCEPQIRADNLDLQILQSRTAPDQINRVKRRGIGVAGKLGRHEGPEAVFIHWAHHRRHIVVDQPVHDAAAVYLQLGQVRRAEDDAVILQRRTFAHHARADGLAHRAARSIRADHVRTFDRPCGAIADVADLRCHAARGLRE